MAERRIEYWGTGKRKTAVARVRLFAGSGTYVVNRQPLASYFGRETGKMIVEQPFAVTRTEGQFDLIASVQGGGNSAQASAIRHGLTRALLKMNPDFRPVLRSLPLSPPRQATVSTIEPITSLRSLPSFWISSGGIS